MLISLSYTPSSEERLTCGPDVVATVKDEPNGPEGMGAGESNPSCWRPTDGARSPRSAGRFAFDDRCRVTVSATTWGVRAGPSQRTARRKVLPAATRTTAAAASPIDCC